MSETGERIKKRRKQIGMSADTLAEYLGVDRSTIYRYEKGDIEKIPAQQLPYIANALKTSQHYLMGWVDDAEISNSNDFPKIMEHYEKLNDIGKQEATKRVEELTHIPRYFLEIKAAHNDYQNDAGEKEKMQEDIDNLKRPE
ncbi:MAG: helix-turn-helix transcriptional regulator [Lachnospiraceae bacterium]|nr:helix-turn-helix transcriptional regulator [Lachnospiraceae bacterium]